MRILAFGDNFIDKFVDRGVYYPGGNALNVAVFATRLGAHAEYLGVFGDDDLADHLHATLAELGIPSPRALTRHGETGWAEVKVVESDRVFLGWNEGGVATREPLRLTAEDVEYATGFDLVHSAVYAGTVGEVPKLAGRGALLSFDFSEEAEFRTPEFLDSICPSLDLALFSGGDDLAGTLRRAVAAGAGLALGTRGAHGSLAYDGTRFHEQTAVPVTDAVDTMGCGDSFVACFAVRALRSGWTPGKPLSERNIQFSLQAASEFAAAQTRTEGAFGHSRKL